MLAAAAAAAATADVPSLTKVLLISDPETKTSAAAMDVHVGHFSDPGMDIGWRYM